jgi:imidazolonepropionase-like amidohydrolase
VTTVRDVGSRYHVGFSLKRAQRSGLIGGARFYTSGPIITTTAGHATEFQPLLPPIFAVEANGPWREFNGEFSQTRESLKASLHHTQEGMAALFGQLRAAGVRFGVGTDSNAKDLATIDQLYFPELEGLAANGLPRMQIMQSATLHAAEAMGLDAVSGSLATGKWADVVVLNGDPLVELRTLVAPAVVIQAGRIVHDARPPRQDGDHD